MSHKNVIIVLLVVSVLALVAGILLVNPEQYGICPPDKTFTCIEPIGNNIGQPLFMGSIALLIVFLLLFFLPADYFKAWRKYAAWFIVVAIIWITTSDVTCSGFLPTCIDKELATWWSNGIYLVLSLLVIITTYFQWRKSPIYTPGV